MHSLIPVTGVSVASKVEQEARVDRLKLAACGLVGAVVLSGCSAGQVSQTAVQEPAVNGTSANIGEIAVRNAHLRATQTADYVQPGGEVELLFLASNGSPDVKDKLVSITSDIGTVALTGDTAVPAGGALVVGAPDGQITALESVEATEAAEAKVNLSKPISNGLTYNFTFTFEKGGQGTIAVPISAGETPRREEAVKPGESHGGSGGH
jgi:copper(I)-binding protein